LPLPHCTSAVHLTQVHGPLLQMGVAGGQSELIAHCTQLPKRQTGVAPPHDVQAAPVAPHAAGSVPG